MLNSDPMSFRAVSVNHALPELLARILQEKTRGSRNGRMKELGPVSITIEKPWLRYVSVAERKVSLPAQIAETMWVLSGRNDVEWLSHYLPRAKDFSDDGTTWSGGYGPRLRAWGPDRVDQLWRVVELLREDTETRRAVINLYDPARDTEPWLKDVPCNNWLSFRVGNDGRLHLNVATRSNDIIWGWSGINTFEWSVLLAVVCALTGLAQGTIRYNITSFHLYERHFAKAHRIVDANQGREIALEDAGPRFTSLGPRTTRGTLRAMLDSWFRIEAHIRSGDPDVGLGVNSHPDALMREWLWALRTWHLGLRPVPNNHLNRALANSPALKVFKTNDPIPAPWAKETQEASLLDTMVNLHKEKDAVYGDSWCRRGEKVSILANIARKVDRLGKAGAGDTELDTAMDLTIYLVKYRLWLADHGLAVTPRGVQHSGAAGEQYHKGHRYVEQRLRLLETLIHYSELDTGDPQGLLITTVRDGFERLLDAAEAGDPRGPLVTALEQWAFLYTSLVWDQLQAQKKREQLDEKRATQRFDGYALAGEEEESE